MFCHKCGKEIDDEAVVCIHCGVKVGIVNNNNLKNIVNSSGQFPNEKGKVGIFKKFKLLKKWQKVVVCCILTFFCLGIIVSIAASSSTGSNNNNNTVKTSSVKTIGDTITNSKGVSVKLVSVEDTKSFGLKTTAQNFIVLRFDVYNGSTSSISFNPLYFNFELNSIEYDWSDYDYDVYDINPGISRNNLYVVYETSYKSTEKDFNFSIAYSVLSTDDFNFVV